jgi:hypothetical protein
MWRPYFASAAWDPFANGTWAWYSGAGYSWVSPYPWAWTPYHSGSWSYCDNIGWGWMPFGGGGEGWYGLNNAPALTAISRTAGGHTQGPNLPGHPPLPHMPSMIAVNTKPIAASTISSSNSFVFRKDSAGLGVPRSTLGNLNKFSRESISHGSAHTAIYASVPRAGQGVGSTSRSEMLGASIHRGFAPSPNSSSSGNFSGSSYAGGGPSGGMRGGGGGGGASAAPAPSAPSMPAGGGGGVKK